MPAGRPKKPSRVKKFEGNRSKVPIFEESVVSFQAPSCPKDVPKEAKEYWKMLAPDLIRAKKLNQFNAHSFKEYCIICMTLDDLDKAIYETCRSLLQEDRLYDAGTGKETVEYKESALSKIRRQYLILHDKLCKSFGFTAVQFGGHYRYKDDDEQEAELI